MTDILNREQIIELVRCAGAHDYFLKKYLDSSYTFDQPDGTCSEDVMLKYFLWKAMFNSNQSLIALFPNDMIAKDAMESLRNDLEMIPSWLKSSLKVRNTATIQFDNGSSIYLRNSNPNYTRGMSFRTIAISNHVKNMDDIKNVVMPVAFATNCEIIRFS